MLSACDVLDGSTPFKHAALSPRVPAFAVSFLNGMGVFHESLGLLIVPLGLTIYIKSRRFAGEHPRVGRNKESASMETRFSFMACHGSDLEMGLVSPCSRQGMACKRKRGAVTAPEVCSTGEPAPIISCCWIL